MIKTLITFICLLFATTVFAQNAVVVELSKNDAEHASQLYEAKQKADKDWDDFYTYTSAKWSTMYGWTLGIDFSKDFRFIVPKAIVGSSGVITWGTTPTCPCVGTCVTPATNVCNSGSCLISGVGVK